MKQVILLAILTFTFTALGANYDSKSYYRYLYKNNISESNISIGDDLGETPLHRAAAAGDFEAAQQLLTDGAQYTRDADGQTPMMYAIMGKRIDFVIRLIEMGATIDEQDGGGNTAEAYARSFLEKNDADIIVGVSHIRKYTEGATSANDVILRAAKESDYYAVKALLDHYKQSPDVTEPGTGNTLLHLAAMKSSNQSLVALLFTKQGEDIFLAKNEKGQTPLFVAVASGNARITPILMGPDARAVFMHGEYNGKLMTPYQVAKKIGNEKDIKTMNDVLEHIIDNYSYSKPYKVLAELEKYNQPLDGMLEVLNRVIEMNDTNLLDFFRDAGIPFDKGYNGVLPLNLAVEKRLTDMASYIVGLGVSPDKKDGRGKSARQIAQDNQDTFMQDVLEGLFL